MNLRRALEQIAAEPQRACIIIDFDGTLAPVVDDPARARPLPAAEKALARLAGRVGRVAIVSGRPVPFLQAAVAVEGLTLVGQYGLQHIADGRVVTHPAALAGAAAAEAAARHAETQLPGLTVERKGIAVTLHWRTAPELETAALELGRHLAEIHGLATQPGRLALELRPDVASDKGTAARRLLSGSHAALVAGDDHGDIAMFSAMRELVASGELAYGLAVAVRSAETPPGLVAAADHCVDGPAGVAALLDMVADVVLSG